MFAAFIVFVLVTALVLGIYVGMTHGPAWLAARRLDRRLREVSRPNNELLPESTTVVTTQKTGPLPAIDKVLGGAGSSLSTLIEQSGVRTTPSAMMLASVAAAVMSGVVCSLFVKAPMFWLMAAALGALLPILWLKHKRTSRMRKFEEQFPEALDLLSRAIRAGHAFQTAMGMVADELPSPVGVEFKKAFDQQNFGLPLREVLDQMAERVPLLDVKFFVTAVSIQRETGGNLSEILDNLAHVVRERFKILRQVRVHTAHGRFTGYVLMALPATLAIALSFINPEHMNLLFEERMGQMMILGAIVMQAIGYVWIKQVIKIEV
ncbi:MAG TPA: type II secretion system F family protein [Vicinamibacterales bacterium]|nr:type II secretion system F family protein [Vicinamibacterales bacterium]